MVVPPDVKVAVGASYTFNRELLSNGMILSGTGVLPGLTRTFGSAAWSAERWKLMTATWAWRLATLASRLSRCDVMALRRASTSVRE